jgi:hypothetical protein
MPFGTAVELGHVNNNNGADPYSVTAAAAAAVGDLVVVYVHNVGVTISAVTDSRGNTYTRTINNAGGGFTGHCIAWSRITTAIQVGDTWSISDGFGTVHTSIEVVCHPGAAASPLDQSSVNAATTGTANWTSNSAPTTGQADDRLVGGITCGGSATHTVTPAGGWVDSPTTPKDDVAGIYTGYRSYQDVAATGGYAYSGTASGTPASYAAGIIAFKAAGAPAAQLWRPHRMPLGV